MFDTFSKDAKIVIGKIVPLKKAKIGKKGPKIQEFVNLQYIYTALLGQWNKQIFD